MWNPLTFCLTVALVGHLIFTWQQRKEYWNDWKAIWKRFEIVDNESKGHKILIDSQQAELEAFKAKMAHDLNAYGGRLTTTADVTESNSRDIINFRQSVSQFRGTLDAYNVEREKAKTSKARRKKS